MLLAILGFIKEVFRAVIMDFVVGVLSGPATN
jgi:hypothetical protein